MDGALVLFSGGQDSSTCLAWALNQFDVVETLAFDYGQRNLIELECRIRLRDRIISLNPDWKNRLGKDHFLPLKTLGALSETALTRDIPIKTEENGLPNTFVPGRNLIFLIFAAALAYRRNIRNIVVGVCETDYSGYPDCRNETIQALQTAINLGMDNDFTLHTPLMWIDKSATWDLAYQIGGKALVELIIEESHTCYLGKRGQRHAWGYGCGTCLACKIREKGWTKYTISKQNCQPLS
ncbi:Queuosine Biosynthesis QueC ATPase [Liberibacter crescens BT-1]|uniref:7-cyano-7-deazaguanine synthase n=1 Tax=Liberibacter crescens (strain BT-1) TaxID=1215343 RepID=L0EV75_LIBCB|nr:7-cyano-7-deazaguanine synthase QueC [Liberibacter crescens]AGA64755.1 Queuosine Biosynthesis QueC ATPase [Liberibacter crescens BT-1]AMC12831.1 7-cyano-7-deazaguanine synthase [Liberibacter crescens]